MHKTDLEWKVVYVGSAESSTHDQTLDEILVGPVPVGINKFILQADAPDPSTIPQNDILGVTVILVTCSYREREFVRVGYYVNNEYTEEYEEGEGENGNGDGEKKGPPMPLDMKKVVRTILADKPRVTRFQINWGDLSNENQNEQQQQNDQQLQQQQDDFQMGGGDSSNNYNNGQQDIEMTNDNNQNGIEGMMGTSSSSSMQGDTTQTADAAMISTE